MTKAARTTRDRATPGASAAPEPKVLARTKLKRAGGSLVVTVPAAARNLLNLAEGQEVAISVEGSRVVLEPVPRAENRPARRPKYTLAELVADAQPNVELSEAERVWHDEPPKGGESW